MVKNIFFYYLYKVNNEKKNMIDKLYGEICAQKISGQSLLDYYNTI